MFGVRIPTQDKHSAVNIRVVDFMPVYYGSTAIFPKELVEISGADFDIDKVYAQIKQWYVKNNKFIEYGKGKTLDEAGKLTRDDVAKELGGLPAIKMHCSNLASDALKEAIKDYKKKKK